MEWYKKWWIWSIIVLALLILFAPCTRNGNGGLISMLFNCGKL